MRLWTLAVRPPPSRSTSDTIIFSSSHRPLPPAKHQDALQRPQLRSNCRTLDSNPPSGTGLVHRRLCSIVKDSSLPQHGLLTPLAEEGDGALVKERRGEETDKHKTGS
ncbi:unnamed protein product [Pleuronectes platessa]|uniref:Uncharacterized protein n=1 Tax=Pleuronectes platessa TaxID=8262 RepID=A0A9N7Y4P8_PLEPL|nr:unnamed protein product [Pleuronectes platessa]